MSPRVVHGDTQPLVRVGALDTEDVDEVVTVEAVQPVQAGRGAVGQAHDARGEGGGHRPALERQRRASPTVSTPEHGDCSVPSASSRRSTRRLTPSARDCDVEATPC